MFEDRKKVLETVKQGFNNRLILVVGDLILDHYLWGDVTRISPESPVPVVQLVRENEVGGGAANVALNLNGLGLRVAVVGYVGRDLNRNRLFEILQDTGIDISGVVTVDNWTTITKTRVIGGKQQMIRIDREVPLVEREEYAANLLENIFQKMKNGVDAIIISDYAKGVISDTVCRQIITTAKDMAIPVYVDPKGQSYAKYDGATAITPNRLELAAASSRSAQPLDQLLEAGQDLCRQLHLDFMATTLGELGIALVEEEKVCHIPAHAREVYDVSGAGDTVISTVTAGMTAGLCRLDSLNLANLAAGFVVGKVGTRPIRQTDLLTALSTAQALAQSEKICTLKELLDQINEWRAKGDRIVFTNGCFDLLHAGHVKFLEDAKRLGSRLVVGINTDSSVRKLKGETRPVIGQDDRARVLAALSAVDAVTLFAEETPLELIRAVKPDILTKGDDYTIAEVVGADEVKAWNGEVSLIALVDGKSSTNIVQSIQAENSSSSGS